jgi:hypothetical protein
MHQRMSIDTSLVASRRSDFAGRLRGFTSIDAESTTMFLVFCDAKINSIAM